MAPILMNQTQSAGLTTKSNAQFSSIAKKNKHATMRRCSTLISASYSFARTSFVSSSSSPSQRKFKSSSSSSTTHLLIKKNATTSFQIIRKSSTDQDGFSGQVVKDLDELPPDDCDIKNPDPKKCEPVRLKIDNVWYDARGWAKAHPGGERWIHFFDGRDATDAFYALHSYGPNGADLALRRLQKLPKCDPPKDTSKLPSEREYEISMGFREFRKKLEADGFFKRNAVKEIWALSQVIGLYTVGTAVAYSHPVIATVLLALGAVQAGWLGHDYVHGRGKLCDAMRYMPTLLNGHSVEWWTQKHSMHHTFTNEEDMDGDVMMEPFFYLRHPKDSGRPDSPMRKWQHIYGYPLLSIMYWLWRSHSVKVAWREKRHKELIFMGLNYVWLATCMPWQVALGSVTLGGFIVGSLVSATHQSEEIMDASNAGQYVDGQFRSTRDAEAVFGPLETWIWGGMDTQLEHHLFPTMPRYNYHKLRPILKAWAKAQGIMYRSSPSTTIIADNWKLLDKIAHQA